MREVKRMTIFIIVFILCVLAAVDIILNNLVTILLVIAFAVILLIVLYNCLSKWPMATVIASVIVLIVIFGGLKVKISSDIDNNPVKIYKVINPCVYYDLEQNEHKILRDSVIAKMTSTNKKMTENRDNISFVGYKEYIYTYTDGSVTKSTVSKAAEGLAGYVKAMNRWGGAEFVKEITYKEFRDTNWWEVADVN